MPPSAAASSSGHDGFWIEPAQDLVVVSARSLPAWGSS